MASVAAVTPFNPITPEEAEARFNDAFIAAIQEMARDNFKRLEPTKNLERLNGGTFYPNDYFYALQDAGLTEQLQTFINEGYFFHGYASPKHFTQAKSDVNPTGFRVDHWTLSEGVDPNAAMDSLEKGPTLINSGTAQVKAYYVALRMLLGNEKFGEIFASSSETPLTIAFNLEETPFNNLLETTDPTIKDRGARVYFKGIQAHYIAKNVNGERAGYHAVALGNDRYVGLGLNPEGATIEEVNLQLKKDYNRPPVGFTPFTTEVGLKILGKMDLKARQICKSLKYDQITDQQYCERGGGLVLPSNNRISPVKLAELVNATLPEAKKLMALWKKTSLEPVQNLSNSV